MLDASTSLEQNRVVHSDNRSFQRSQIDEQSHRLDEIAVVAGANSHHTASRKKSGIRYPRATDVFRMSSFALDKASNPVAAAYTARAARH